MSSEASETSDINVNDSEIESLLRSAEEIIETNRSRRQQRKRQFNANQNLTEVSISCPSNNLSLETMNSSRENPNNSVEQQNDDIIFVPQYEINENEVIDLCSPREIRTPIRHTPFLINDSDVAIIDDSPSPPQKKKAMFAITVTKIPQNNVASPDKIVVRCPICLESAVGKNPVSTTCGHIFCRSCLNQTMKIMKQCPVCKRKISPKNIHNIFL